MAMAKCPKCGAYNLDTAKICLKCRAVMSAAKIQPIQKKQTYAQKELEAAVPSYGMDSSQDLGMASNGTKRQDAERKPREISSDASAAGSPQGLGAVSHVKMPHENHAPNERRPQKPGSHMQNAQNSGDTFDKQPQRGAKDSFGHQNNENSRNQKMRTDANKSIQSLRDKQKNIRAERNIGPMEKRGRKGAVIGAIVLPILILVIVVPMFVSEAQAGAEDNMMAVIPLILFSIPTGALYGFGYAFGMDYVKKWSIAGVGVAFQIGFGAYIVKVLKREEHMSAFTFPLCLLALTFGISCGWIPGVIKGIRFIYKERKAEDKKKNTAA